VQASRPFNHKPLDAFFGRQHSGNLTFADKFEFIPYSINYLMQELNTALNYSYQELQR